MTSGSQGRGRNTSTNTQRILPLSGPRGEKALSEIASALAGGELAVVPTDTVYGVAAHPSRQEAVRRLFVVKGRDEAKPIPFLAESVTSVERAGALFSASERRLAGRFWPGPLTLVLRSGNPEDGWMEGFRVPAHEGLARLLRKCGGLLRVTSANLSGDPPALTAAEAMAALAGGVKWALDGGRSPGGVASTVVRVDGDRPVILRAGALSLEQIVEACG